MRGGSEDGRGRGERGDEQRKGGGEGRGGVEKLWMARLSELSVRNKPRCLRDGADESGCVCEILSSLPLPPPPPRGSTRSTVPFSWIRRCRVSPLLYICYTPPVYQVCVCVECSPPQHNPSRSAVFLFDAFCNTMQQELRGGLGGAAIFLMSSFLPFTCSSVQM